MPVISTQQFAHFNTAQKHNFARAFSEIKDGRKNRTAHEIFGSPDDMKLKSSMTLFSLVPGADPVFQEVLDKFYEGVKDSRTLELLEQAS